MTALHDLPAQDLLAASGVGSLLSGAFGYCPACAMVGRKPVE